MKPLYTQNEYDISKSTDKLPCQCYNCNSIFNKEKKYITSFLNGDLTRKIKFCSVKCRQNACITKQNVICVNCNNEFTKTIANINQTKSGNHFCNRSCAVTYNNKNKTHGTRRSKLEIYIETQLSLLYPKLHIDFNQKSAIGSELDIYIPSLNIAFELNGIFHYEPIYGVNKLDQIQNNDISKSKACHDKQIDLCVIDTSQQKYVKPSTSQKYLDIIITIINERLMRKEHGSNV